jgi:hypothetical protein
MKKLAAYGAKMPRRGPNTTTTRRSTKVGVVLSQGEDSERVLILFRYIIKPFMSIRSTNRLSKFIANTSAKNQSWLDELKEYARILIGTTLAYGFFRLMKAFGMDDSYVVTLEKMDQVATVIVVGCYLSVLIRRAFFGIFNNA